MSKEEEFCLTPYVPPQFIEFVIDHGTEILKRYGFAAAAPGAFTYTGSRQKYESFLTECAQILKRFRFDLLEDAIARFEHEIAQFRADIAAKARSVDPLAGLHKAGWNPAEIEFVERSLEKGEHIVSAEARSARTDRGRTLDRLTLRQIFKPKYWINQDSWNSQFPKLSA